ncbi:MAG: ABC transporter permease [Oscillospiraceae bacterium]
MKKLKTNTQTKQRLVTLLILVLIMVILSCISNKYLTVNNLINIVRQESTLIIIACAATMLMISGGMDLSPAGVIALTSVVFAKLCVPSTSLAARCRFCWRRCRLFSGLLVLPMFAHDRNGVVHHKGLARDQQQLPIVQGLPANFGWVNRYVGPFPLMVVIAVAVFAVFYILLNRTLLGKYAYAIGGNSETARLSGIKVNLVRCVLYILTALMSSFVGILMSSRINSGDPNLSTSGIEFEIIVAIILGGTSLLGGQGSLIGTLIGALILGNLSNGMNLLGIGTVYQFIVEGAVLVVAVVLDLTLKGNGLRIKKLRRSN